MSAAREYPEKPPENPSPVRNIDSLAQLWTLLNHHYKGDTQIGNVIEAQTIGPLLDPVVDSFTKHIDAAQDKIDAKARNLIRQIDALAVLKGMVFESIIHAHGHTRAFINSEPLQRMGETTAEAAWRTKMANYVLSSDGIGIVVPNFSSGINVQVAPLIHTCLPGDERSGQAGYVDPEGTYRNINELTSEGKISLSAAQAFSVPILGKVEKDYRIESSDENFSATDDPSYRRNSATQLLVNMYQSAVGEK